MSKRRGGAPGKEKRRAHSGQVLIFFALLVTFVLLPMVAVVTDTSMIWLTRRGLQNAVDAAALAAAQELPDSPAAAREVACDYATGPNAVDGMTMDCEGGDITIYTRYVANDTVQVTAYRSVSSILGTFGLPVPVQVHARATARIGSIFSNCPFPIFQTPEMLPGGSAESLEFYTLTAMHLAGADNQKGNFLTVDVGSGANAVLEAMVNNTCGSPIGPDASTEPGGKIGKVLDGFQWRIYCAGGGGSQPNQTPACPTSPSASACPSADVTNYLVEKPGGGFDLDPAITRDNCTRLVVIPIFPGPFTNYNGRVTVTIEGFAIYYIAGVCTQTTCTHPDLGELKKGDSWGYYVRVITSEEEVKPYDQFGFKIPVLVCNDGDQNGTCDNRQ